uniref:Uncharacterized protein n=1 Tax=Panagrolaimus davidi TaxID=227884 RepID=A0A914PKX2_9BILA
MMSPGNSTPKQSLTFTSDGTEKTAISKSEEAPITAREVQANERLFIRDDGIYQLKRFEKRLSPESCEKIGKKYVDNDDDGTGLHRTIGLISGIGFNIGCIVGSGIFISPSGVQSEAGSLGLSLLIWVCAGIFVIFGSFCYIELGLLLRESGGDYSYIHYAFGGFASFLRLWIEAVVVRPGTVAVIALTFATYSLKPFIEEKDVDSFSIIGVAIGMISKSFIGYSIT